MKRLVLVLLSFLLSISGCKKEEVIDSKALLVGEWKGLEQEWTNLTHFADDGIIFYPDNTFALTWLYNDTLATEDWTGTYRVIKNTIISLNFPNHITGLPDLQMQIVRLDKNSLIVKHDFYGEREISLEKQN